MKTYTLIVFLSISTLSFAQDNAKLEVKNTIISFFDAFHKQDSIALKSLASENIILQTIGKNREGVTRLRTEEFSKFLKSIVSIPKDKTFKEKLLDFNIQIDGEMAHAWTPYEFWFDGKFSHCGVNSFQLIKMEDQWKIVYLVDTRRREGCE